MMVSKEVICIVCPMGCNMTVSQDPEGAVSVQGNGCPRGKEYGKKEFINPERTITTSVWIEGGTHPLVSVKTTSPVPKSMIFHVLRELSTVRLQAPLPIGTVVLKDVAGSGVDVVTTRNARASKEEELFREAKTRTGS